MLLSPEAVVAKVAESKAFKERICILMMATSFVLTATILYLSISFESVETKLTKRGLLGKESGEPSTVLSCPGQYQCRIRKIRQVYYHDHYAYLYVNPSVSENVTAVMMQLEPKCVPLSSVCDGVKDCPDRDDEAGCTFDTDNYLCRGIDRLQIPAGWYCDGTVDCPHVDDEDPKNCNESQAEKYYSCSGHGLPPIPGGRTRIPWSWKCDGERDCRRGEDEKHCNPPYPAPKCSAEQFRCKESSTCIEKASLCNKVRDCPQADDEDPDNCRP